MYESKYYKEVGGELHGKIVSVGVSIAITIAIIVGLFVGTGILYYRLKEMDNVMRCERMLRNREYHWDGDIQHVGKTRDEPTIRNARIHEFRVPHLKWGENERMDVTVYIALSEIGETYDYLERIE